MDEVNNNYIEKALNELIPVFGIKEFIVQQNLINLLETKKTKECIKSIASYLGIPIEVDLSYVPKGYRPNSNDGFNSSHLVKTDRNGKGVGGITAQVNIPHNLPMYGTPSMVNFPIKIRVSEDCAENPDSFITVMAHELSHIVLHSMWHKEKDNEFYTDLTAMILGFADIMKNGRKVIKTNYSTDFDIFSSTTTTHTETTTYGYLSDNNFNFAFKKINFLLDKHINIKNELLNKIHNNENNLNQTKNILEDFIKCFDYISNNHNKKISQADGLKISMFYQFDYINNFDLIIKENENNLNTINKFINNFNKYSPSDTERIQLQERNLQLIKEDLTKQKFLINKDLKLLKKYIGLIFKIRLWAQRFLK